MHNSLRTKFPKIIGRSSRCEHSQGFLHPFVVYNCFCG
uniref:Uncharacterized protein n=1 Tax=Arundo donax TaxID=35708 RepID=A0A0A9FFQ1_ARUDO